MRISRVQKQEVNRNALLAGARRLIAAGGGTSLDAIAEESGLTTGAVYSIFGSKRNLLYAMLEGQFESQAAAMTGLASPELDLEEVLAAYGRHAAAHYTEGDYDYRFELHVVLLAMEDRKFHAQCEKLKEIELDRTSAMLSNRRVGHLGVDRYTTDSEARHIARAARALVAGYFITDLIERHPDPTLGLESACVSLSHLVR